MILNIHIDKAHSIIWNNIQTVGGIYSVGDNTSPIMQTYASRPSCQIEKSPFYASVMKKKKIAPLLHINMDYVGYLIHIHWNVDAFGMLNL